MLSSKLAPEAMVSANGYKLIITKSKGLISNSAIAARCSGLF